MTLRESLRAARLKLFSIEPPAATPKAVESIQASWSGNDEVRPEPSSLGVVSDRVRVRWREEQVLDGLPLAIKRYLPYVLFYPDEDRTRWLAAERGFLSAVAGLVPAERGRFVRKLVREVIRVYPDELRDFHVLRLALQRRVAAEASLTLAEWRIRDEKFGQLGASAVDRLSQALRGTGSAPLETVNLAGFGEEYLAQSRLLRRACEKALDGFAAKIRRGGVVDVGPFLEMLAPNGVLRWKHEPDYVAGPLLTAFQDGDRNPEVAEVVKGFLLGRLGDPRLTKHRAAWRRVRPEAHQVMLRWLVKSDLDTFFRIFSQSALDNHWKYRLAFWKAYLDDGRLDEAWVILGPTAEREAGRADAVRGSFANLTGGSDRDQCALLLKLAGLTILEFSHNGKYRIWDRGSEGSPELYRPFYRRADLATGGDEEGSHVGSASYSWQRRLADAISGRTGISISQARYRVQP